MGMYEFSVLASGLGPDSEDLESRFYEAGCDDATVSFQKGWIILDFAREAESMEAAIASALNDIRQAGAQAVRIEPDPLVSLSDISERSGLSRAAASLFASGQRGEGFPPPVIKVTTKHPLWAWASVARWLCRRGHLGEDAVMDAETIARINQKIGVESR